MQDIFDYIKGNAPLNKREKILFSLIDELNDESYNLFCEIIDFKFENFSDLDTISTSIVDMYNRLNKIKNAFEYLKKIEESSYIYATNRFRLKSFLATITTITAFISNIFLGITSFILLNKKATDDYYKELVNIENKIEKFEDEDELILIEKTLDNCDRLFKGKVRKLTKYNLQADE